MPLSKQQQEEGVLETGEMKRIWHHLKPNKKRLLTNSGQVVHSTKTPNITLKELQGSKVEMGVSVHRTILSRTLQRVGLGKVARLWKSGQKNTTEKNQKSSPNIWKKVLWSDKAKMKLFDHQGKRYVLRKLTLPITPKTPFPQ